jgi:hypothetical protein
MYWGSIVGWVAVFLATQLYCWVAKEPQPNLQTMRKLIYLAFAILKSRQPFDPNYAV